MKQSLLDIAHPHPRYNFRPYRLETYGALVHLLNLLQREQQDLQEHSITSGIDDKGAPFITFESEEVLSRWQKLNAEIRYIERLIRIRRFWRPRDWFSDVQHSCSSLRDAITRRIHQRQDSRIAHMDEQNRITYYRKRVQTLEKQIIAIYDDYAGRESDCSFIPARALSINDNKVKEKLEPLLWQRATILDKMFQATSEELNRLTTLNNQLRRHVEYMAQLLTDYYRANAVFSRGKNLEEWIEISLNAYPFLIESYAGDDFYGSNFEKILQIEYELMDESLEACETLRIYPDDNPDYDADHLVIDGLDRYQSNDDWKEYWSRVDALRDIRFCNALHQMSDHQGLPLVDILQKTSYSIDLKHDITISKEQLQ